MYRYVWMCFDVNRHVCIFVDVFGYISVDMFGYMRMSVGMYIYLWHLDICGIGYVWM